MNRQGLGGARQRGKESRWPNWSGPEHTIAVRVLTAVTVRAAFCTMGVVEETDVVPLP
jgi:hypothetical protein